MNCGRTWMEHAERRNRISKAAASAAKEMTMMRAKMRVNAVLSGDGYETLEFSAVAKSDAPYPADGSDENNSFARWTPSAQLKMTVQNPALFGKFKAGDTFYVDFSPAAA